MKRMFLSILVIGLLVIPCIANALSPKDDDLLLYLACNDGKGNTVTDLSPNGNDGEIVGKVDWVDGKYGKALEFSEQGEVKAPYIPLNSKSFTICLWTKPELAGASEQCVFTQTQVNAQNTSLHYRIYTNGTVRMGFYSNDLDAPAAVKAGEWVHICFWLDIKAKSRRIYLDGEQVVEDAGKAGIEYLGTAGDTMIGSWGATGQKYNGVIDEVQVWDRALSEKEIKDSMKDITITPVDISGKLTTTWGSLKSE
jgi:hypothetical protein